MENYQKLIEELQQKLVENQDLTVLCRGLGRENEQLLRICSRRAEKIFKLEKELKEETEENEMLIDALSITDNNKYTKLYFEQLNKVFNANKEGL